MVTDLELKRCLLLLAPHPTSKDQTLPPFVPWPHLRTLTVGQLDMAVLSQYVSARTAIGCPPLKIHLLDEPEENTQVQALMGQVEQRPLGLQPSFIVDNVINLDDDDDDDDDDEEYEDDEDDEESDSWEDSDELEHEMAALDEFLNYSDDDFF